MQRWIVTQCYPRLPPDLRSEESAAIVQKQCIPRSPHWGTTAPHGAGDPPTKKCHSLLTSNGTCSSPQLVGPSLPKCPPDSLYAYCAISNFNSRKTSRSLSVNVRHRKPGGEPRRCSTFCPRVSSRRLPYSRAMVSLKANTARTPQVARASAINFSIREKFSRRLTASQAAPTAPCAISCEHQKKLQKWRCARRHGRNT
jgi:hypothetical protein